MWVKPEKLCTARQAMCRRIKAAASMAAYVCSCAREGRGGGTARANGREGCCSARTMGQPALHSSLLPLHRSEVYTGPASSVWDQPALRRSSAPLCRTEAPCPHRAAPPSAEQAYIWFSPKAHLTQGSAKRACSRVAYPQQRNLPAAQQPPHRAAASAECNVGPHQF